jgi:hypothetical protein
MAHREGAKECLIQQRKDRGVGTDTQSESYYGNRCEDRGFADLA